MARRGTLKKPESKDTDTRPIRLKRYPHIFLIVCEDGNTEPYYFETFKNVIPPKTIFLKAVGTGRSSIGVVEQAILEREKLFEEANKTVDEVWAVFDKDDADISPGNTSRFNDAFTLAQSGKIDIAYSNEAFELWLLLHFIDVTSEQAIPRAELYTNLDAAIKAIQDYENFVYEHGKTAIIDVLIKVGNETLAIERSEKLLAEQNGKGKLPIDANPCTTVHALVKRLRELIEYYSYTPE